MSLETSALWFAAGSYAVAGTTAIRGAAGSRTAGRVLAGTLLAALGLHALSIGARWTALGHGPFVTMHEILSSNVFSLTALFALACWRLPVVRASAPFVLPVVGVMLAWLLATDPRPGHMPPTYHTAWLYVHVGFGKVFLGAALVAVGLSGIVLARLTAAGRAAFASFPASARLDELSSRFLAGALVFDTLMLVAGAIWAQDAWGRAWAWDPLETWAFLTWLLLAFALHVRSSLGADPVRGAVLAIAVFVVAFLTFFGVPFVTRAPHQGMM